MAFTFTAVDLSTTIALSKVRLPKLGPTNSGPAYLDGWDLGVLGGHKLPGKSRITGGKIRQKHDKKSKAGADGANPTFHGIDPQEFTLEVEVWTDEQLRILVQEVCADVLPKPWSKPQQAPGPSGQQQSWPPPVRLIHPQLSSLAVLTTMDVVILGGTPLKWVGTNMLQMSFDLLHWLPAPTTKPSQVATPLTAVQNKRAQADAANQNPPPHAQPGYGGPPPVTPGT